MKELHSLIDQYIDAYNRMDVSAMLATLHSAIEFQNVSGNEVTVATSGIDEFASLARQSLDVFFFRRITIVDRVTDGDGVLCNVRFVGVLRSQSEPQSRLGSLISLDGRSTFTITEGKISEIVDAA